MSSGNVAVNDSSFVSNSAVTVYRTGRTYQEGDVVVIQSGNFTAFHTEFINNVNVGSNGGGVHVYIGSVFIHHCKFLRNRATGLGRAIAACVCPQWANITINDSMFSWNTANSKCRAVYFLGVYSKRESDIWKYVHS